MQRLYLTTGVPESFIVDKRGILVEKVVGRGAGRTRNSWPNSSACWLCQPPSERARLMIGLRTVSHDLAFHGVNHILGHVCRQIANTLQMA